MTDSYNREHPTFKFSGRSAAEAVACKSSLLNMHTVEKNKTHSPFKLSGRSAAEAVACKLQEHASKMPGWQTFGKLETIILPKNASEMPG